jgi:hypothetical protein
MALGWTRSGEPRIERIRMAVLLVALLTVLIGWPLARHVNTLRIARYATDPAVAARAKAVFGSWHAYSLMLNFVTLLLVTAAMALAARLPSGPRQVKQLPQSKTV